MSGVRAGRATRPYTEVPHEKGIHPNYVEITATCSCGNVIKTHSTVGHDLNSDVCGKCHPFFTGKQRVVDTGGRVERFNKRFSIPAANKLPPEKAPQGAFCYG
ncbi:50S ribosomal protein L31 [Salmonella enterica subsp. enterica serovar Senftenberg]|nr:50S ribosomal protein L31 [Salmonella enterica subsp. enterica serovar Senftenberg]